MNQCPICKGTGEIEFPLSRKRIPVKPAITKEPSRSRVRVEQNTIMAKLLRKEGYSFQEIADFLGYRSKRSVQLCLERDL